MSGDVTWTRLAVQTVTTPARVASDLLDFPLPRAGLWTALALVAAINTIIVTLSTMLGEPSSTLPAIFANPIGLFVIVAGGLVVTVHAIYWTGRMLGGKGALYDLLILMIWLQALRVVAQIIIIAVFVISPVIAGLLLLAANMAVIWILLNFVSVALQLNSLGRAAFVLIAATVALAVGLIIMISMIGVTALGIPASV